MSRQKKMNVVAERKQLIVRLATVIDADEFYKFFLELKGKTVIIDDVHLSGLGMSQKVMCLYLTPQEAVGGDE